MWLGPVGQRSMGEQAVTVCLSGVRIQVSLVFFWGGGPAAARQPGLAQPASFLPGLLDGAVSPPPPPRCGCSPVIDPKRVQRHESRPHKPFKHSRGRNCGACVANVLMLVLHPPTARAPSGLDRMRVAPSAQGGGEHVRDLGINPSQPPPSPARRPQLPLRVAAGPPRQPRIHRHPLRLRPLRALAGRGRCRCRRSRWRLAAAATGADGAAAAGAAGDGVAGLLRARVVRLFHALGVSDRGRRRRRRADHVRRALDAPQAGHVEGMVRAPEGTKWPWHYMHVH